MVSRRESRTQLHNDIHTSVGSEFFSAFSDTESVKFGIPDFVSEKNLGLASLVKQFYQRYANIGLGMRMKRMRYSDKCKTHPKEGMIFGEE